MTSTTAVAGTKRNVPTWAALLTIAVGLVLCVGFYSWQIHSSSAATDHLLYCQRMRSDAVGTDLTVPTDCR